MAKSTCRVKLPQISPRCVYQAIGVKGSVVPPTLAGTFPNVTLKSGYPPEPIPNLPPVTLVVYPTGDLADAEDELPLPESSVNRRIYVLCPNCGRKVPFGNLPSHYTTKSCDNQAKHERAKLDLPNGSRDWFAVGKHATGYTIAFINPYGFTFSAFQSNGEVIARISGEFADDSNFSMAFLNASAFADWFAELENPPVLKVLQPSRFAFWKTVIQEYAVSLRPVAFSEVKILTGIDSKPVRAMPSNETAEQRRERLRRERKENKESRDFHIGWIKSTLAKIFSE